MKDQVSKGGKNEQCLRSAENHKQEQTLLWSPLYKHNLLVLIRAGMMLLSSDSRISLSSHTEVAFVLILLLFWTPITQMTDETNLCCIPGCIRLLLSFFIKSMLFIRQTSSLKKKKIWRIVWK